MTRPGSPASTAPDRSSTVSTVSKTTAAPWAQPDVEIPTRVLVLGMAHHDGTIVADELYPVAEACGLTADQVRSCLRRLVERGSVHPPR